LLDRAEADGRLILTLDKDSGSSPRQRPRGLKRCGVILFRMHPAIPENLQPLVDSTLHVEGEWIGRHNIQTGLHSQTFA